MAACTFQTKHRGYVFPDDLEEKIATVRTTAQLEDLVGSPQVKTVHGDEVWIYFGEDEKYHGPFPLTYDNKTVLLAWVKGKSVTQTKILHDDDLPDVDIDPDETEIFTYPSTDDSWPAARVKLVTVDGSSKILPIYFD